MCNNSRWVPIDDAAGVFFCTYQASPTDEIYGWFERRDRSMVSGSGGWWRTSDFEKAYKYAMQVAKVNQFDKRYNFF